LQATLRRRNKTGTDGEILTLDEAATCLKAGKWTIYRLAQKSEISASKLGGSWRFRRSELIAGLPRASTKRNRMWVDNTAATDVIP